MINAIKEGIRASETRESACESSVSLKKSASVGERANRIRRATAVYIAPANVPSRMKRAVSRSDGLKRINPLMKDRICFCDENRPVRIEKINALSS